MIRLSMVQRDGVGAKGWESHFGACGEKKAAGLAESMAKCPES